MSRVLPSILSALALSTVLAAGSCSDDASVAEHNIIKAADNFEITRRITFVNGITDRYLLEVVGLCSMEVTLDGEAFNVICKDDAGAFRRHTMTLSDNVFVVVEQLDAANVSDSRYRVTYKPEALAPDIELR